MVKTFMNTESKLWIYNSEGGIKLWICFRLEISEDNYKKTERYHVITMFISSILAIAIIYLLPVKAMDASISILLVILVGILSIISNTVNIFGIAYNKERFQMTR